MGYINSNEVMMLMPEVSDVEKQIAELNEKNQKYLEQMANEIQTKATKYEQERETLTESIRKATEDELNSMYSRYQTTQQTMAQDAQAQQMKLIEPLREKLLAAIDEKRPDLREDVREQVNINIKYDGYIRRQMKQVEQFKKMENKLIPEDIVYEEVHNLRKEAVQKLNDIRPHSIGQASRISGVSPSDISVLLVYMEQLRRQKRG